MALDIGASTGFGAILCTGGRVAGNFADCHGKNESPNTSAITDIRVCFVSMFLSEWRIVISRADITLAIALFGAILGIFNLWLAWRRDRIRLRVIPKLYARIGGTDFTWPENDTVAKDFLEKRHVESPRFCIEVQNLGLNPVTIGCVGFLKRHDKMMLAINNPVIKDGGQYPRRLEPHSSFVVYTRYTPSDILKEFGLPYCAFAETGSGRKFHGTSPVLQEVAGMTAVA